MIRSRKYLAAAKDQPCTLRFFGVCLDPRGQGHETTVFAHFRHGKGMGQKAHDFDGCDACFNCHKFLDEGWMGKISQALLYKHMLTALERTLLNRIERGIVVFPVTMDKPASERPVKPRKPKALRKPIQNRNAWPAGRKPQSRNDLKRTGQPVEG